MHAIEPCLWQARPAALFCPGQRSWACACADCSLPRVRQHSCLLTPPDIKDCVYHACPQDCTRHGPSSVSRIHVQIASIAALLVSTLFSYLLVLPAFVPHSLGMVLGLVQAALLSLTVALHTRVTLINSGDPDIGIKESTGPLYCAACNVRSASIVSFRDAMHMACAWLAHSTLVVWHLLWQECVMRVLRAEQSGHHQQALPHLQQMRSGFRPPLRVAQHMHWRSQLSPIFLPPRRGCRAVDPPDSTCPDGSEMGVHHAHQHSRPDLQLAVCARVSNGLEGVLCRMVHGVPLLLAVTCDVSRTLHLWPLLVHSPC